MRSIALFLPNWIGDVVMATPAIRAVRAHFRDARLLAVCKPYVADTLAGAPWFDETILFEKKGPPAQRFAAVAGRLRDAGADAAVLFPNSFRAALLARVGGCDTVVGFARYFRDTLLSRRLYPARDRLGRPKPTPVIDDYNRLVEQLGVPDPGYRMELFTTPADELAADGVWARFGLPRYREVVGLNPGGAFGAAKHWPTAAFADLARALVDRRGAGVVVLCGPTEREIAREIAATAGRPGVVALADVPLSLGLTKAVVRRLSLLVTTDSGPRHFAGAFDVPVVSLFGPTHIAWTETHFAKAVHLQKPVPCGPCQQRVCPLGHHRCMTELSAVEVFSAAERLLQTFKDESHQERRHAG
ncbi:lipopolysaccharide heptosyltransferase II [Fimbriiglobus ruber]|uniref:lipopolysaccharide heptosyltransferase II n=1 Tax=Fimbriiglobus ruber TaxID=1908690 RepID=A0A225DNR4_9BACT|nr:lipopolysaccharide heptosyltransferase II [Fimbriiglobus ruber]OWK43100.1 ADP-heptose--lipooligosaccharide heptosyltransferase II [Fimbriiglobus ruber]